MNSLWRLASGSSIEEFARDVYIKSNLTAEINRSIKVLHNSCTTGEAKSVLSDCSAVHHLCDAIEAVLLHGLKQKLSTRVSSVFAAKSAAHHKPFQLDYWPLILILCHNEVSRNVHRLANISTDIGRCRAWLRQIINEGLLNSYLEALTSDASLLHGFYRSSAYIRDGEHTDLLRHLITGLDSYVFELTIDCASLNSWNWQTLKLIGIGYVDDEPTPVMTAFDAIQLISSDLNQTEGRKQLTHGFCETERNYAKDDNSIDSLSEDKLLSASDNLSEESEEIVSNIEVMTERIADIESGNSINRMTGWSTPSLSSKLDDDIEEDSYDNILQTYSTQAVLSSTPDIRDFTANIDFENINRPNYLTKAISLISNKISPTESMSSELDFEVIPKSIVLNNSEPDTQIFLSQLTKLANEWGLDEQDYKCSACSRPIGMIYGKSRMCHFDGHQYCLDCHINDESFIPARIIYNWNFHKYPVAKRNKYLLLATESEPFFDIKLLSPMLYSMISELKQTLELRTQLFFLHAYLFTCQESIAMEMRKLVWPREHLFEHIHLYSIADLTQVHNNMMTQTLRKVITFAKKHVLTCPLCTLKGYYCEICKSAQILYPFDTDSTNRCEKCKTVFHLKCFNERYDKNSCPKCLRIEKREINTATNRQQIN